MWKISLGWTIQNSAVAVGISYDYAQEIVKKYNNLGDKAVKDNYPANVGFYDLNLSPMLK